MPAAGAVCVGRLPRAAATLERQDGPQQRPVLVLSRALLPPKPLDEAGLEHVSDARVRCQDLVAEDLTKVLPEPAADGNPEAVLLASRASSEVVGLGSTPVTFQPRCRATRRKKPEWLPTSSRVSAIS